MSNNEIVVGVDGSAHSRAAMRWAAAEAARRGATVVAIHAYDWRWPGARMVVAGEYAAAVQEQAKVVVDEALTDIRAFAPGVDARGETVLGQPGFALSRASEQAALVVVGSRGLGGFGSLVLGSVSQQLATHATSPVVVVRGRTGADGPVVVGVDGSAASEHALRTAFELAAGRGCGVVAIRVWPPFGPAWGVDVAVVTTDDDQRFDSEREQLTSAVAPWREKYPEVEVETVATRGHPAEMLASVSGRAQLVVVGRRGHGGFAGLQIGSVSLQVLHHADCPVVIDHDPAAA